jgi:tripartite-type tricarboxylate transporter receptor subunit TctC
MRKFAVVFAAGLVIFPAHAQDYPNRPVRVIVATTAGSATDNVVRLVGARLTEMWGQQIVVDNRPGASGLIGAEIVAKASPDGYTLWLATMTQLISTNLYKRYPMASEYTPVGKVASTPYIIAVTGVLPVRSIEELVAHAKAHPGKLLYGTAGIGSTPHLCMELFNRSAGVQMTHVPYRGSTVALTDMMGGQLHVTCAAAPVMHPYVKGGKVRVLGVSSEAPTELAPGLRPIGEAVPGFVLGGWYGMLVPKNTPPEIVARVNRDLVKVLQEPELRKRLLALGAEPEPGSAAQFAQFLDRETARWTQLLREANIRPPQ